ncbi:DUF2589 domain-containing protein, partial [Lyngbya confervoides]
MADVTDITSIPLYQILGAPLSAMVDAEIQAAQTTVEFIERIGFVQDSSGSTDGDRHYGDLKTVTFNYSKISVGGEILNFKVEIPVISLVPIPTMQI